MLIKKSLKLLNQQGSGLVIGIAVMAGAIGLGSILMHHLEQDSGVVQARGQAIELNLVTSKLATVGAYFVSNNLIICKQGEWMDGKPAGSCAWNPVASSGEDYKYEDFFLKNPNLVGNELTFELDIETLNDKILSSGSLSGDSQVSFTLKHRDDIDANLGAMEASVAELHADEHYVYMSANLGYRSAASGLDMSERMATAFRRPMSFPIVEIDISSCEERCDVSRSEHNNPSCRSTHYLDEDTITSLDLHFSNLGPGVLYEASFERQIVLNEDTIISLESTGDNIFRANFGQDIITAGQTINTADSISCAHFVRETQTNVQITVENMLDQIMRSEHLARLPSKLPLHYLITNYVIGVEEAVAQATGNCPMIPGTTCSDTTTNISQHSNPLGTVSYIVGPDSPGTSLEPYRMLRPQSLDAGDFTGLEVHHHTVNTTVVSGGDGGGDGGSPH